MGKEKSKFKGLSITGRKIYLTQKEEKELKRQWVKGLWIGVWMLVGFAILFFLWALWISG